MKSRSFIFGSLVAVAIVFPFAVTTTAAAVPLSLNDLNKESVVEPGDSFTFTINGPDSIDGIANRGFDVGSCTGTFASPQVEAGGILSYGLHVKCVGTGFLPLSAKIKLQEEYLGTFYNTVHEASRSLTEGGYGFVRGEAICHPDDAGHDYRIDGQIFAGEHYGAGLSAEVHLPCNL